ncbi:hypothetical protein KSP40_PGU013023 [Platanthera guangdongensis]|uniref:Uncharacterized protein n=1 Tax=Platanthera guangdongensis TaxID=2320717 RepID=A0ABR2LH96_9ASPA
MILTIFLILVPVLLFAVSVSQRLVNEFQHHLGELIRGIPLGFAFYVSIILFIPRLFNVSSNSLLGRQCILLC